MITFRSEVGPDIMMFDEVAHRMMEIMGKEKSAKGVVTPDQLPGAIQRLQAAAALDRAQHAGSRDNEDDGEDEENRPPRPVGLSQRIVPLIELLEISLARQKPVTWGV